MPFYQDHAFTLYDGSRNRLRKWTIHFGENGMAHCAGKTFGYAWNDGVIRYNLPEGCKYAGRQIAWGRDRSGKEFFHQLEGPGKGRCFLGKA